MKRLSLALISVLFLFASRHAYAERLNVIASIHPLADMVKQIGGERVDVKTMLPPGASPHTFEPTPLEMIELRKARVFVKVGAGLEFWAERMIGAWGKKEIIVVEATSGMQLIRKIHSHDAHDAHGGEGKSAYADPHVWLDPLLAKEIVDKIADAVIKVDPQGRSYYKESAERYKEELDSLHKEILDRVKRFKNKEYVTFHPAWNYFSQRYGLKVAGVIEESPGRDPSPKHIARIVKELKKINSKVIFAEPQFSPKIAEVIAKEAGARVLFLDPIGSSDIKGRDTYIGIMRYNISVMEEAMK